jgi:organic hydroperoxide reductase OsmC/OhrA
LPNPGDLLCAALANCEDATVRMIADILGVTILDLRVEVTGDAEPERLAALQKQAEGSCVNLDTLRSGLPVKLGFDVAIAT